MNTCAFVLEEQVTRSAGKRAKGGVYCGQTRACELDSNTDMCHPPERPIVRSMKSSSPASLAPSSSSSSSPKDMEAEMQTCGVS
jgi:hypothetical protein